MSAPAKRCRARRLVQRQKRPTPAIRYSTTQHESTAASGMDDSLADRRGLAQSCRNLRMRRRDYHLPRRRLNFLRFIPRPGCFPTFLPTSGAGNHRTAMDYGELVSLSSRSDCCLLLAECRQSAFGGWNRAGTPLDHEAYAALETSPASPCGTSS